jgi:lipid A 3-O-deacylase
MIRTFTPLFSALLVFSGPVAAADLQRPAPAPSPAAHGVRPGYELRLGVFAHDPWSPEKGGVDINAEGLTPRLFGLENPNFLPLVPRLHAGATVNTAGKTSSVYAGFTWTLDLGEKFFIEGSLGGAFHNGKTGDLIYPDHNALGCSPLFRESASIGYRITPALSVIATVEHLSNSGLCSQNRGLTNAGVRLGYSF